MSELSERIKEARKNLHLSQEYVANFLNLTRTAVVEMEYGRRKVSAEELRKLSELFKVSADELLNGKNTSESVHYFTRAFLSLNEIDKKEIMNLIEFKRRMKMEI